MTSHEPESISFQIAILCGFQNLGKFMRYEWQASPSITLTARRLRYTQVWRPISQVRTMCYPRIFSLSIFQ